jgi:four helix bundle protein
MNSISFGENPVLKLTLEFSLELISYCELLENMRKFIIAKQLLRAGTSIGANCCEAQNAESKADFIHKFKIASKECGETLYWLQLCVLSPGYPECKFLREKVNGLNRLIGKIISTSKRKHPISYFISFLIA